MLVQILDKCFVRKDVEKDIDWLYLFTDNANRTSGKNFINPLSWYYQTYGKVGNYLCYPNVTQAVIRGLNNARPITTMVDQYKTQWTDSRYMDYVEIATKEIAEIMLASQAYLGIKVADSILGKGSISSMKETAPACFEYLCHILKGLGIDNTRDRLKLL